jgi:hypothetical protein
VVDVNKAAWQDLIATWVGALDRPLNTGSNVFAVCVDLLTKGTAGLLNVEKSVADLAQWCVADTQRFAL